MLITIKGNLLAMSLGRGQYPSYDVNFSDPTLSRLTCTVFGRVLEDVNSIYYFDVHSTDST